MTALEYFAAPGVSNSMLGHLKQSPAHLQSYLAQPEEKTKAMEIGTFFHDLLLLAESPRNIAIKPEIYRDHKTNQTKKWNGNATPCREWAAEQTAAGLTILTQDEHDRLYGMVDSIMANPRLKATIETGEREMSLFAPYDRVMRKGRIDLVGTGAALFDFKTTTDASPRAFQKTVATMEYYRQSAYYLGLAASNGMPQTDSVFVAVEKHPPYAVAMYHMDESVIEAGRQEYRRLLDRYIECLNKNEWPAYSQEPQLMTLPAWVGREEAA